MRRADDSAETCSSGKSSSFVPAMKIASFALARMITRIDRSSSTRSSRVAKSACRSGSSVFAGGLSSTQRTTAPCRSTRKKDGVGRDEFKRLVGRLAASLPHAERVPQRPVTAVAAVLDGVVALPASAPAGRTLADPDEDAVTLAAEAALPLLERAGDPPRALVLATTSPPYDEGGSVQALAELLGLAGDRLALELTSSLRDGL